MKLQLLFLCAMMNAPLTKDDIKDSGTFRQYLQESGYTIGDDDSVVYCELHRASCLSESGYLFNVDNNKMYFFTCKGDNHYGAYSTDSADLQEIETQQLIPSNDNTDNNFTQFAVSE